MKTYSVILTPEAEADLREIYRYIASVLQERTTAAPVRFTKLNYECLRVHACQPPLRNEAGGCIGFAISSYYDKIADSIQPPASLCSAAP